MRPGRLRLAALAALAALPACGGSPAAARAPAATAARPAAAPAPVASPAARDADLRGPLLWQVDGEAGPSYLFGTIHAGASADRDVAAVVWQRLAECDTFYMEADLAAAAPGELARRASLPPGQSLDKLLGKRDWNRLVKLVGRGVPAGTLKPLAPWMAYSLVVQLLHPTPRPLDLALEDRASSLGKAVRFLEDWTLQIDLMAETMGIDDLRELVIDDTGARARLEEMVAAYRAGDFDAIAAIALDPKEVAAHPDRHRRMFEERNRAWAEALGGALRRGKTFVAVGVGHFPGEAGLLGLLRARGLAVHRVDAPPAAAPADTDAPPIDGRASDTGAAGPTTP